MPRPMGASNGHSPAAPPPGRAVLPWLLAWAAGSLLLFVWGWVAPAGVPFSLARNSSGLIYAVGLAGFIVLALYLAGAFERRLVRRAGPR